ncbi:MAG: hypothetical protein AAFO88_01460 [Pseudomonadota bacterium]
MQARAMGYRVAHAFAFWPEPLPLLPGCAPLVSEPVFVEDIRSLMRNEAIEAFCHSNLPGQITLTGIIDPAILQGSLLDAARLGLDVRAAA